MNRQKYIKDITFIFRSILLILLVLFIGCIYENNKELIIGKWIPIEGNTNMSFEFTNNGLFYAYQGENVVKGEYAFINNSHIIMQVTESKLPTGSSTKAVVEIKFSDHKLFMKLGKDELTFVKIR